MKKIKTKFSWGQLFFMPLLVLGLTFGVGLLLLTRDSSEETSIWEVIFLFLMGFFFLYWQIKHLKSVKITNKGIFIKNLFSTKFLAWKDISHFKLTGYQPLFFQPTRATSIILENDEKEFVFDLFYRNSSEFKRFLKKITQIRKAKQPIEIEKITLGKIEKTPIPVDYQSFKRYSGNPLFSIYGAGLFIISGCLFYFFFKGLSVVSFPDNFITPTVLWLFIFLLFGHQYHYFHANPHFLIVRHQFFFWKKKAFRLSDILEINFEEPYRRNKGIRVTTKGFESYVFLAGSLSDETWKELRTYLKRKKVKFN